MNSAVCLQILASIELLQFNSQEMVTRREVVAIACRERAHRQHAAARWGKSYRPRSEGREDTHRKRFVDHDGSARPQRAPEISRIAHTDNVPARPLLSSLLLLSSREKRFEKRRRRKGAVVKTPNVLRRVSTTAPRTSLFHSRDSLSLRRLSSSPRAVEPQTRSSKDGHDRPLYIFFRSVYHTRLERALAQRR